MSGRVSFLSRHPSPPTLSRPRMILRSGSRIQLGYTGNHFDDIAAQLEGFARPVWDYAGKERWVEGLKNGTDPNSDEFWGNMRDKDQRMVECSPMGFFLSVAKEHTWDKLGEDGQRNLENWLAIMNGKEMPNTNWLWFRVFANLGLKKCRSSKYDGARMKADMDHLDTFYIGDGWSRDGPEGVVQLDYYSSSWFNAKLMEDEDPERSKEYKNRAVRFAQDFVHYFDERGMIYRFATGSFWGALAFADVELPAPLTWGVIKGLLLRTSAYNKDGSLTIGYCFPNMNLTENYNSPGSPYWCCKSFIPLALPETHPFWAAAEEPYPTSLRNATSPLRNPLHVATNLGGHTFILSSGQQCSYPVKQSAAKYGKFAYSSAFGYSIPVGSLTLEELGGDNTLALSDDNGEVWKCRRETREARIEKGDVQVETWLLPPQPENPLWHVRVHRIKTGRPLISAEGGFAIYGQGKDGRALNPSTGNEEGTLEDGSTARATSKAGVVGIAGIEKDSKRTGKAMRADANTNIIWPRTVLPTLMGEHNASDEDHWLFTAVFAVPESALGQHESWVKEWEKKPVDVDGILSQIKEN
ncbi:hypothetical protein FA13DRAFT_1767672 [Coprinellus micaceus]|uniref:Uncharacterized protein n=1 Tax=Coprinellus micaceus TaxID=71717 RepID=A0A4Y7S9W0_COPMI|nr:hypothetical protein FA13DRAFT_1767672 [Coprinellus micaceus]